MQLTKKRNTKLNALLADMDEEFLPNGKLKLFAIGFYKISGEYVFLNRAKKTGLKQNMKTNDFKGVVAVDIDGNKIGHPYPVKIYNIHSYKSDTYEF